MSQPQLAKLAEPIPRKYLSANEKGMESCDHTVITQLLHLRAPGWSFEVREVLRSQVPDKKTANNNWIGGHYVTGVVCRLTCTIDGHPIVIDEVGGVELAQMKDGDGERLKHAISDALKRCAMRIGLGLHVWAQEAYFLDRALKVDSGGGETPSSAPAVPNKPALGAVK